MQVEVIEHFRFPFNGPERMPGDVFRMPKKWGKVFEALGKVRRVQSDSDAAIDELTDQAQELNMGYNEAPTIDIEVNALKAAIDLAKDNGIDLTKVQGTGKDGRILKRDVNAYMTRMMVAK